MKKATKEVLNITDDEKIKALGYSLCGGYTKCTLANVAHGIPIDAFVIGYKAAAEATVGKGYDPAVMDELVKAAQELLECDYTSGTHLYCAQVRVKAALTKAKL